MNVGTAVYGEFPIAQSHSRPTIAWRLCMAVILPPEMLPQQTGAVQVVQRARWMTSKWASVSSEVGGTLSPAAAAMYGLVEVRCRRGTSDGRLWRVPD